MANDQTLVTANQPDKLGGNPTCPACDGQGRFRLEGGDVIYFATDYRARLYRCAGCGIDFQHPMPARATIATFYPAGYWLESLKTSPLAKLMGFYVKTMLQLDLMRWFAKMTLAKGARYLDLGCSRGDFLAMTLGTGVAAEGVEGDPQAADHARRVFGVTIHELDLDTWQPELGQWAGISMFHVLEHVSQPRQLLEQCRLGLQPGGKLLLRVPNINSWQSRLFGRHWKPLDLPRHLTHFHPKAMSQLLDRVGLRIIHQTTWSLRDGPPAWAATLFPAGEPTFQQIHKRPSVWRIMVYLILTWLFTPIEILAAFCGGGSMMTVLAEK